MIQCPNASRRVDEYKSEAAGEAWLEHRKRARTGSEREGRVDPGEFGFAQTEIPRSRVLLRMLGVGRLGDREERRPPHEEAERNLARGRMMRVGDLLQHAPAWRPRAGKSARVAEWAVGDNRDAVIFAPRKHGVLDARSRKW